MREAAQKLDRAAQDAERERHQLAGLIGAVRKQDEQRNWLLWAASGTLVVGLLVLPFVAEVLPFGGDSAVAAVIMNANRWNAGIALMQAGSPDGWRGVAAASDLVRVTQEALAACRVVAAKAKKEHLLHDHRAGAVGVPSVIVSWGEKWRIGKIDQRRLKISGSLC